MFNSNKAGWDETKMYISLIEELLEWRLLIEDFIDIKKLSNLVKDNKMFRGITISQDALKFIDDLNNDEFTKVLKTD